MKPRKKLGALLLESGLIDEEQLQAALDHQKHWGGRLGRILVEQDFLSEYDLFRMLAKHLDLPIVDLSMRTVQADALAMVGPEMATRYNLLPIGLKSTPTGQVLHVAMSDPTDMDALDQLQTKTGARIVPLITEPAGLHAAIAKYYSDARHEDDGPEAQEQTSTEAASDEPDIPVVTGELLTALPKPGDATAPAEMASPALELSPAAPAGFSPAPSAWSAHADTAAPGETPALDSFGALADPTAWETPAPSAVDRPSCPACHTHLVSDARFCFQCGHNLSDTFGSADENPPLRTDGVIPNHSGGTSPSPFGLGGDGPHPAPTADFSDWSAAPEHSGFHDPFAPTPSVSVTIPGVGQPNAGAPAPFANPSAELDSAPKSVPEELPLNWADALELPLPLASGGAQTASEALDSATGEAEAMRTPPWAAIPRAAADTIDDVETVEPQKGSTLRTEIEALTREELLSLCLRLYERDAISAEDLQVLRAESA